MEYTYEEVLEAYIKLKTYIYYDSTNLFMRKQLAIFETNLADSDDLFVVIGEYNGFAKEYDVDIEDDEDIALYERKLRIFTVALNTFHENPKFFERFLGRIKTKFLPKKIIGTRSESQIITNKRTNSEYNIERSTVFIDAPIEIHLTSVLWILKEGVTLDRTLFDNCFGNRLILNKEEDKVVQGSGLFKPYPKQYQKWRDESVKVAREHLDRNKDVLILNLDIKDFFYSVRLDPKTIQSPYANGRRKKMFQSINNLYLVFEEIHKTFTQKLLRYHTPYNFVHEVSNKQKELTHYILPIGLLSSFILANHYLKDFDSRVLKHARPLYYGRYVDDILMVIANPILPEKYEDDPIPKLNFNFEQYRDWVNNEKPRYDNKEQILFGEDEVLTTTDFKNNLSDIEQFILLNFHPIISVIDKPAILGIDNSKKGTEKVFKLNSFPRLYCQSDKTLLYYFDKDESSLVIDKLKRDLEEKSSEFRNYNDEEDLEDFEESAYHLLYDGTEGKVRTLKDYKEDKFGLSVFLSKRIFNSLRRADKISEDEASKIVKFFQGENALNLYSLWERVFVFLLVNNRPEAYVHFYLNCCEAIKRIRCKDSLSTISNDDYQANVLEHLDNANELTLSLHPKFLSEVQRVKRTYHFSFNALKNDLSFYKDKYSPTDEDSYFITRYRQSNLIRHHYVSQPLLSYTTVRKRDYQNYTNLKIPF
ncbi:hypothetical protein SAMN05216436_10357 [bacterium A37T11]|nr:hypothetical protein SAMN05216436_10357 [bacterium A37T11]